MYLVVALFSLAALPVFVSATPDPVAVNETALEGTVIALYRTEDSASGSGGGSGGINIDSLRVEVKTSYTYQGCAGTGHLAALENAEKDAVGGSLCSIVENTGGGGPGNDDTCIIGLIFETNSAFWLWEPNRLYSAYENWAPGQPFGADTCAYMDESKWYSTPCNQAGAKYFLVQYNNCTAVSSTPTMDDDWDVTFRDALATFDDTSTTDPELVISYNGSAPNGPNKYYMMTILLAPDCTNSTTDGAVAPAVTGMIPEPNYDAATGILTAKVDIDTDAIEGSADFWTRISATQGTIDLCVRMDLFNEHNYSMAVETTRITLTVDTTTGFEVLGVNYTNELVTQSLDEEVRLDYPIMAYFCDDNNAEVTPAPTLFPGDVLQVCVKTNSDDAFVTDVRSVAFRNDIVFLVLEVIDGDGEETNGQTLKTCDQSTGICNIKSVTFSALYLSDINNNGVLVDIAFATTMRGTAVLQFGVAGNRRLVVENIDDHGSNRRLATVTGFDLDLGGNLEQRPDAADLGEESTSPKNNGATAIVGGGIGAGVVIAALAAAALMVYRSRRDRDKTGEQPAPEPVMTTTANGMAMI